MKGKRKNPRDEPQIKIARDLNYLKRRFKLLKDATQDVVEEQLKDWNIDDLVNPLTARQLSFVEFVERDCEPSTIYETLLYCKTRVSSQTFCTVIRKQKEAFIEYQNAVKEGNELAKEPIDYVEKFITLILADVKYYRDVFQPECGYPLTSPDCLIELIVRNDDVEIIGQFAEVYDIEAHDRHFLTTKYPIPPTAGHAAGLGPATVATNIFQPHTDKTTEPEHRDFLVPPVWNVAVLAKRRKIFEYLLQAPHVQSALQQMSSSGRDRLYLKMFRLVINHFRDTKNIRLLAEVFKRRRIIPKEWDDTLRFNILRDCIRHTFSVVHFTSDPNASEKPTTWVIHFKKSPITVVTHLNSETPPQKWYLEMFEFLIDEGCPVTLNEVDFTKPLEGEFLKTDCKQEISLLDEALQRYDSRLATLLISKGASLYTDFFGPNWLSPWDAMWSRVPQLKQFASCTFMPVIIDAVSNFTILTQVPAVVQPVNSTDKIVRTRPLHPLQLAYNAAARGGIPLYLEEIDEIIKNSEEKLVLDRVYGGLNNDKSGNNKKTTTADRVYPLTYYFLQRNNDLTYWETIGIATTVIPFIYYIQERLSSDSTLSSLKQDVKKGVVTLQGALRAFYQNIYLFYERSDIHEYLLQKCKSQVNNVDVLYRSDYQVSDRPQIRYSQDDPRFKGRIGNTVALLLDCMTTNSEKGWKFKREILRQLLEAGADANYPVTEKTNRSAVAVYNLFDYFAEVTLLNDQAEIFQVLLDNGAVFYKKTTGNFCSMNNIYPPVADSLDKNAKRAKHYVK